jgi:2-dehydropantoate 2-reductase
MCAVGPITIVGAGGIGCAVGHALLQAGAAVTFVDADHAKIAWGRANGVCVDGKPAFPTSLVTFDEWQPSPGDTVLLCTKCYDNASVLGRLSDATPIIPIQNGFDPLLESRCREIEGIASFISECLPATTHTRITRFGKLHLGNRGGLRAASARQDPSPALGASSSLIDFLCGCRSFKVSVVDDILPYKYTKLLYNAAISPLAAAAGLDNGQLLSLPAARRLFFDLIRENYTILREAGIRLARIGPFHPDTVQRILRRRLVANAFAWAFYPTLRRTYCSMAGDLPRGRTEIDFYNRHLIDLAGTRPCPLNRAVYALVKRMECERIAPHPGVLDELTPLLESGELRSSARARGAGKGEDTATNLAN